MRLLERRNDLFVGALALAAVSVCASGCSGEGAESRDEASDTPSDVAAEPLGLNADPTPMTATTAKLVLFGGDDGNDPTCVGCGWTYSIFHPLDDTWAFDGNAWHKQAPAGGRRPPPAVDACGATLHGQFVLFGGMTNDAFDLTNATWVGDGAKWTQQHPPQGTNPPSRYSASMATLGDEVVLFGGLGNQKADVNGDFVGVYADTWVWDGATWSQKMVEGPSYPLGGRWGASMATFNGKIVLFGGSDTDDSHFPSQLKRADTWEWDGTSWSRVTGLVGHSPPARVNGHMTAANGKLVLFGGTYQDAEGHQWDLNDTWEWDGRSWTNMNVVGPHAREGGVLATLNGRAVLFGGSIDPAQAEAPGDELSDAWEWDGRSWTKVASAGPDGRFGAVIGVVGGK